MSTILFGDEFAAEFFPIGDVTDKQVLTNSTGKILVQVIQYSPTPPGA
jgi:hypothetical protein